MTLDKATPLLAVGPGVVALPLSVAPRIQRVVERALSVAWREVQKRIDVKTESEAAITTELTNALNRYLDDPLKPVSGFSGSTFETIQRGGETQNYNGSHIEKRPDLTIRLGGRRSGVAIDRAQNGIFVECKILDSTHSLLDYCKHGVARFVIGDYAWAMTHAMMVAYVRDASQSAEVLARHLTGDEYACADCGAVILDRPSRGDRVIETRHRRAWRYPQTSGEPGHITLVHLWLLVD
ncbi:MAG: hypothetical protein ABI779_18605 [Acidobacteriota bacterium]